MVKVRGICEQADVDELFVIKSDDLNRSQGDTYRWGPIAHQRLRQSDCCEVE